MKETKFIADNIEKWEKFEDNIKAKRKNPEEISKLYVEVTDDLAYSQTFYKNRSIRLYLNGVAQVLFNEIYHNKKIGINAFYEFWKIKLPVIMYQVRRELLIAFLLFAVCTGIGILSSIYQPDFARFILGDAYVEMTIANINNDDPMAVYKSMNEVDMFLGITLNNIRVAFFTFLLGIFMAVGTVIIMVHNGIMIGTFQYFFIERDLFWESFLTIWLHGTLEISSIVIAGAAGLTMGKGLLFPGSYSRFQSLRLSAKRGIKIMIGLVPVFTIAAFIEGFITRHTDVPYLVRAILIIISLVFILYYFVFYPKIIARRYPDLVKKAEKLNDSSKEKPKFNTILSGERLFSSVFQIIKSTSGHIIRTCLFISLLYAGVIVLFSDFFIPGSEESIFGWNGFKTLLNYKENRMLIFLNSIVCAYVLLRSSLSLKTYIHTNNTGKYKLTDFLTESKNQGINALIAAFSFNFVFFLKLGWGIFLFIIVLPFILLAYYHATTEDVFFISGIDQMFRRLKFNFSRFLGQYIKITLICFIFYFITLRFSSLFFVAFDWNLYVSEGGRTIIYNFLFALVFSFIVLLTINAINIAVSLVYYNMYETITATKLIERINNIGTRKKIRGYETE